MRGGTYYGGSTIAGKWSDWREFPDQNGVEVEKERKKKRKRKAKKSKLKLREREASRSVRRKLIVPEKEARRLATLMSAMGRQLPRRIVKLNNEIKNLMSEGVVFEDGRINVMHPLVSDWLDKKAK